MQTPVYTIASNAGVEGAVVVGKLLEQDNTDLGYDAAKGMISLTTCSLIVLLTNLSHY
jgi:chaperonin GroEL (HSP60 family)